MAMVGAVPKFYGGRLEGMVFVDGKATTQMEIPELANHIGVVLADYDTQLVTMTVREEVAFAMENRGYDRETIKALVVNANVWRLLPYWLRTQLFLFLMNQRAPSTQMGLPNYIAS